MRLHALTMAAFGPFAGTERVDFDALGAGGLFLLRGPTGAGKSSVLDAVCYALYGALPGARPRTRLRSDHARAEVRTTVVLEVTLGGRRLEITRSPEQVRAKKRGTGSTVDKAQTLLRERSADGEWHPSSKAHQEVGDEVRQLLGMSREQFCQVVLLPQGGFARFLHATATERAELLGKLFDTARFGGVEDWLAKRRKEAEDAAQQVRAEIGARLERLREASGSELPPPLDVGPEALEWAAQLRVEARELAGIAEIARLGAATRRELAAERAEAVGVLADRQHRHRRAARRAQELEADAERQRTVSARLERARQAEAVVPLLRLHREAVVERRRLVEHERQCRSLLPAERTADDAEALSAAERGAREELGGLRALLAAEQQFAGNERRQLQLEREREDAESRRAEAESWLAAWPERRRRLTSALDDAKQAAVRAEQVDGRVREARQRCEAAEQAEALQTRLTQERQRLLGLRETALTAQEAWVQLREGRLRGMAAELAAGLVDGQGCPVCGGVEHPAPALAGPGQVTREQEQQAERAYRGAAQAAEAAAAEVEGLRGRALSLAALTGDLTPAELRHSVEQLTAEQQSAQQQANGALRLQEELDRQEHEQELRTAEAGRAAELAAARYAHLEALAGQQAQLAAELERGRSGAVSVAARVAALQPLADRFGEAATAVRAASAGAEALQRAEAEVRLAAEREGFADGAEAGAAALSGADAARLREGLERHRAELERVHAELADPLLLAAVGLPTADPAADRTALDSAEASLRQAFARAQGAQQRCDSLDRLSAGLADQLVRLRPLAAELARVSGLAALTAGTSSANTLRMSLETYVLAARLEQVAAAAAARLKVMSQGRYTLAHSDLRAKGGGRSGLGLSVLDAWTGQQRDTSTLSGGESFFASLALALGLADVVTDEAGGMPLDTLFIDEGFGSLDEDTLEDVLDVLDRLRERDRAVGIVSHVGDLRSRIPTQLEVRKGRNGSTLSQR